MASALRMLARRALSEGELRERLAENGFPESRVDLVLRRLAELGLVDDRELCARLARSYRETRRYGPAKIAWKLGSRAFPPDLVRQAIRETSTAEEVLDAAVAALSVRFRGGIPPGRDGAAKAYRFLAGRGFPAGTCREAIGVRMSETEEGEA